MQVRDADTLSEIERLVGHLRVARDQLQNDFCRLHALERMSLRLKYKIMYASRNSGRLKRLAFGRRKNASYLAAKMVKATSEAIPRFCDQSTQTIGERNDNENDLRLDYLINQRFKKLEILETRLKHLEHRLQNSTLESQDAC